MAIFRRQYANMQAVKDLYLKLAGYSLLTSRRFRQTRNVLEGIARLLREAVQEKRPNKSDSFQMTKSINVENVGNLDFIGQSY